MLRFSDIRFRHDFSCVYAIVNLNTFRCYVGSTNSLYRRKREHLLRLSKGTHHCSHLQSSFNKHGKDRFRFVILEKTENLIDREDFWMKSFGVRNLYNQTESVSRPRVPRKVYGVSEIGRLEFASVGDAGLYVSRINKTSIHTGISRVKRSIQLHLRVCGLFFTNSRDSTAEQCRNQRNDLKKRRALSRSRKKGLIYQFSVDGTMIKAHASPRDAAMDCGVSESAIFNAMKYPHAVKGMFVFTKSETFIAPKTRFKETIATKDGETLRFPSMKHACQFFGFPAQSVSDAIKKNRPYRGYKWEFAET